MMFAFAGHGHGHGHGHGRRARSEDTPPWGRTGWGGPWGGRQRRGDVKYLVLEMLVDGPKHGYEVIRALEERRGVRPSAGSVYPTLQLLQDGGFVTSEQVEGKRVYTITESGRDLLANRAHDGERNEDADHEFDPRRRANQAAFKLGAAIMSARGADAATLEKIRAIIDKARKEIYAVLAADES